MALILRGIKGSALTHAELDNNQLWLQGRDIVDAELVGTNIVLTKGDTSNYIVDLSSIANIGVITGFTFNNSTYDLTIAQNDGNNFTTNIGILAGDIKVTGGTYDPNTGNATFYNNSGGSFTVTGFLTGYTDTYVTGGTYNTTTSSIDFVGSPLFPPFSVDLSELKFTGNTSGDCITDLYITNLHGCSPITVWDSIQSSGSTASGYLSFAFGKNTVASGTHSHAEGQGTIASGNWSHAEGSGTQAIGNNSHAGGSNTVAGWKGFTVDSVVSGLITLNASYGDISTGTTFSSGQVILTDPNPSNPTKILSYYLVTFSSTTNTEIYLDDITINTGEYVADFSNLNSDFADILLSSNSHAEGLGTKALGAWSHAEGRDTNSLGLASHAEGRQTTTSGPYSHAEGSGTLASGQYSHVEGAESKASGRSSHAEGESTKAIGNYSHAEGNNTLAYGQSSHAEGQYTRALGDFSHAEGLQTYALRYEDIEPYYIMGVCYSGSIESIFIKEDRTYTQNGKLVIYSNVLGSLLEVEYDSVTYVPIDDYSIFHLTYQYSPFNDSFINDFVAFVEGGQSNNINNSHAEGIQTIADGSYSHAEGLGTRAKRTASHAEGQGTAALGEASHAEGSGTQSIGYSSHSEGIQTTSVGYGSHAEGGPTRTGAFGFTIQSVVNGLVTLDTSLGDVTGEFNIPYFNQGVYIKLTDLYQVTGDIKFFPYGAVTFNIGTTSTEIFLNDTTLNQGVSLFDRINFNSKKANDQNSFGAYSHSEGTGTITIGNATHAEGNQTLAIGNASHAEGTETTAAGYASHAEGNQTQAIGNYSHSEGSTTIASGLNSHAEGESTTASGDNSHAGGYSSKSVGYASFVHGNNSVANGSDTIVLGANITGNSNNSIYTSNLYVTAKATGTTVFSVDGNSGQLFTVTDSLIGSLFSVNDISGLPIMEAFDDSTILMGSFLAPSLNTTKKVNLSTGSTIVYSIPTSAYTGGFFDYTLSNSTGVRAGNVMTVWSGTSVQYLDTQTSSIGNTSPVTLSVQISTGNTAMFMASATTSNWIMKTIIRSI